MRVVGQLSTLVTCIFAIPALRTQVGKVWWETHSPARLFASEALRLEGMERFTSPSNFPSFFKWYLLQLLTSPSASENGMSQETPRAIGEGKGSTGKLIQDLQLTPRLVVHSPMGHGSTGSKYSGQSQVLIWQSQVPGAVNWVHPDKLLHTSKQSMQEAATHSTGLKHIQEQGQRQSWKQAHL